MISESVQGVTGQTDRQRDRDKEGRKKRYREIERQIKRDPREKQKKTHQFSVPM